MNFNYLYRDIYSNIYLLCAFSSRFSRVSIQKDCKLFLVVKGAYIKEQLISCVRRYSCKDRKMDKIEDVTMGPCPESKYLKPLRMHYKQNGLPKIWDLLKVHDSVSIIIFNITRNVLVFVKQFRPAIYIARAETFTENGVNKVDTSKYPSSLGMTIELCAGIIDKEHDPQVIAQEEILEECGYKVPLDGIQRVTTYRSGVGTAGAMQMLFYAEVTDAMKVGQGGGIAEEGEMIEVVEMSVSEARGLIMDESVTKPIHLMFALMWFYENKWKQ